MIDTNVVVAGLLSGDSGSPPSLILDGMLTARFPFLLSEDLLAEYRAVCLREPIRKRHQLREEEVDAILVEITANAVFREPEEVEPRGAPQTDPGDRHLVRLLATHAGSSLVTGDHALQRALRDFSAVLSPADFVRSLSL